MLEDESKPFKLRIKTIQTTALLSQNTEKNLEELGKLAVTQTPVKDHQLDEKLARNIIIIVIIDRARELKKKTTTMEHEGNGDQF